MKLGVAGIALVAVALGGCAGTFEEARLVGRSSRAMVAPSSSTTRTPEQDARCHSLDDRRLTWGSVAKVGGVLAGASGLTSIPVTDATARASLIAGSAVVGAFAVGAVVLSEGYGASWARECTP